MREEEKVKYFVYTLADSGVMQKMIFRFDGTIADICEELDVKLHVLLNIIDTKKTVQCGHYVSSKQLHKEKEIDLFTQLNIEDEQI